MRTAPLLDRPREWRRRRESGFQVRPAAAFPISAPVRAPALIRMEEKSEASGGAQGEVEPPKARLSSANDDVAVCLP